MTVISERVSLERDGKFLIWTYRDDKDGMIFWTGEDTDEWWKVTSLTPSVTLRKGDITGRIYRLEPCLGVVRYDRT